MQWTIPSLGPVLGNDALMHRLAGAMRDPTCFRFMAFIHAMPPGAMGDVERAALLASALHIGQCWNTGGVVPAPPAPPAAAVPAIINNIVMPAAPVAGPIVSHTVYESRDRLLANIGKFDPARRVQYTAIFNQGTATLQLQHLRMSILAKVGHTYCVLSDADVKALTSGAFFDAENIRPSEVDIMARKINPRLLKGAPLPTELEAIAQVAEWLVLYVNADLGQLILDLIPRATDAMNMYAPSLACLPHELIMRHLTETIFPLFVLPSTAEANVFAAATAATTEFLVKQNVINTLIVIDKEKDRIARNRGHTGALSDGSQRANNGAGGGGKTAAPQNPPAQPPPHGQQYHNPPTNKVRPVEWTAGDLPPYPHPASGVAICYPSRSTFGRCPYASCSKQHEWTGITAPEQTAIRAWLVLWLRKRKWEQFITWSDNGGRPGTWPAICG